MHSILDGIQDLFAKNSLSFDEKVQGKKGGFHLRKKSPKFR